MILGVIEHQGVELPLGFVGLGTESKNNVYLGHCFCPEGTSAPGWARILRPYILGYLVTPTVGADAMASPVILCISKLLRVGLPLGVMGLSGEQVPKFCSELL